MTPAERALQGGLRRSFAEWHFRYQAPIGPFYVDIVSHRARLVIEVDGSQHHDAADYDAERTAFLESRGYKVLRFWNNQVLQELDSVLTAIAPHLPSPLAAEGGAKRRMGGARPKKPDATPSSPLAGEDVPKGQMGGAGRRPARSDRPPTAPISPEAQHSCAPT
jgi:very-short-patch-repair endonuclease